MRFTHFISCAFRKYLLSSFSSTANRQEAHEVAAGGV
nr:MAG TPA_asm: hypothetical protein [Bacteriophage sp.]